MDLCCHERARTEGDDGNVGPVMDDSCVHTEQPLRVVRHLQVRGWIQVATHPERSPHYKILQRDLVLLQAGYKQDRQCTYKRIKEARSRNHCCRGKAVNVQYFKCVSVFLPHVIRHAKRMRRIILSSVAYLALPNFSTLSHKRHDFGKSLLDISKMCVLIFYTTFVWKVSHTKKNRATYCHKCA